MNAIFFFIQNMIYLMMIYIFFSKNKYIEDDDIKFRKFTL